MTRPRRQSEDKVCCRDPNKIRKDYDDVDDYGSNYDFDDDMFNIDYEDFDEVKRLKLFEDELRPRVEIFFLTTEVVIRW